MVRRSLRDPARLKCGKVATQRMSNSRTPLTPAAFFVVCSTATILMFLCFGWDGFPVPAGDEDAFIPPTINLAVGKEFVNPSWLLSEEVDLGLHRFVYHGFLHVNAFSRACFQPLVPHRLSRLY